MRRERERERVRSDREKKENEREKESKLNNYVKSCKVILYILTVGAICSIQTIKQTQIITEVKKYFPVYEHTSLILTGCSITEAFYQTYT